MIIHSRLKDYEVTMEDNFNFLSELFQLPNTEFVIDEKVYRLYENYFSGVSKERLILIEAAEKNKTVEIALNICEKMIEIPAKRNAHLVSVGGGIIQDITGFVANILYRGIGWTFVPTTLLAACDSCIGGKTSLNYKAYKNLLGTFYPPDRIYICPAFFRSLSQRDFESGLGEVVKFNIMAGEEGLANMETNINRLLKREEVALNQFVKQSLLFKKDFIEKDEFDRGERIKLNFAHTFGHAIEVVTQYEIPHGTAVAIGMIMANNVSVKRGLLKKETAKRAERVLIGNEDGGVIHIGVKLTDYPVEQFIAAIRKDKKQSSENLTAVLMTDEAKSLRVVNDIEEKEIIEALYHFQELYDGRSA